MDLDLRPKDLALPRRICGFVLQEYPPFIIACVANKDTLMLLEQICMLEKKFPRWSSAM